MVNGRMYVGMSNFLRHNGGMIRVMILKKQDAKDSKGSWEGITTSTVPFQTVIAGMVCLGSTTKITDVRMIGVGITATNNRASSRPVSKKFIFWKPAFLLFSMT